MLKNHRLASAIAQGARPAAIADCGFYEFKRQLAYKCEWYGSTLTIADRFYPSSQLCSCCNHRQKMPLKERVYKCGNCGVVFHRDLNAAINLEKWHKDIEYPKNTPSSGEIKACGEQLRGIL